MAGLVAADAARWMRVTAAGSSGFTWHLWAQVLNAKNSPVAMPTLPVLSAEVSMGGDTAPLSGTLVVPAVDMSNPRGPVEWWPGEWDAPLTPFGNRLQLWMRVESDDEVQDVLLGTVLILTVEVDRLDQTVKVQVGDLSEEIAQTRTGRDVPNETEAGFTVPALAQRLMDMAGAPHSPRLYDPDGLLPSTLTQPDGLNWNADSNVFDLLQECVALGNRLNRVIVDREGRFRLVRRDWSETGPPPTDDPGATFTDGLGGHLMRVTSSLSRVGAINGVQVTFEDSNVFDPPTEQTTVAEQTKPPPPPQPAPQPTGPDWAAINATAARNINDAIAIARGEIGVGREPGGWIKYQRVFPAYASFYVEYCGLFVAWVLQHRMKIPNLVKGRKWDTTLAYVPTAKSLLRSFIRPGNPRPGDIVLFNWQHVGFVVGVGAGWVDTVEGNVGNRVVALRRYPSSWLGGATPGGFVTPDWTRLSAFAGFPTRATITRQDGDGNDTTNSGIAVVQDGSPLSWRGGTLGRANRVEIISVKDPKAGAAQRRAEELLSESRGAPRTLKLEMVPQPWLDPDDVIGVRVGGRTEVVRVAGWKLSAGGDGSLSFTVDARGWHAYEQSQLGRAC